MVHFVLENFLGKVALAFSGQPYQPVTLLSLLLRQDKQEEGGGGVW